MKKMNTPVIEVILFDAADVLCSSLIGNLGDDSSHPENDLHWTENF